MQNKFTTISSWGSCLVWETAMKGIFFFCRVSTSNLCCPSSCGFLHEHRIYLPRWCFCPRNLPPAHGSLACRKPGARWETVPHSLQPAAALRTGAYDPGTSADTTSFPAAPLIFTSSGNSTICKPVTGPSSGPATATTVPNKSCAGPGEESATPLWVPAGKLSLNLQGQWLHHFPEQPIPVTQCFFWDFS